MFRPLTVHDHAGAPVRCFPMARRLFWPGVDPALPVGERSPLCRDFARAWLPWAVGLTVGALIVFVPATLLLMRYKMTVLGVFLHAPFAGSLIGGLILAGLGSVRLSNRYRRWIEHRLLDAERCPSCGYGLRGLDATDGRLVVCPECRARWRADLLGGLGRNDVIISNPSFEQRQR